MQTQNNVEISASIMCIDWLDAKRELKELETHGVDSLHWDVIDGHFAPDFTMGSSIINRFREESGLKSNYHLMVEEPASILSTFTVSEQDVMIIHQECCRNLHKDLIRIRNMGCQVGVAICPATPLSTLDYIIEEVDVVMLMTVNPGFKGQKLVPQTIRKIKDLRELLKKWDMEHVKIQVDGSVNAQYISEMVASGADILVGGSSGLFVKGQTISESVAQMRQQIKTGIEKRG